MHTGDTDFVKAGGGTHSGRSLRLASLVMHQASGEVIERGRRIVAAMAGVGLDNVPFNGGRFRVEGTNLALDIFQVAQAALADDKVPPEFKGTMTAVSDETRPGLAFPYGTAVCEVEIDPETGAVAIVRYTSVDDVGRALNPTILHGQTHGGIAQGVGQALLEQCTFDPGTGQNLSASFMDYAIPRAVNLPSFTTSLSEVPAASHPLGFRPGSEGGTTPALAVTTNAVLDALEPFGIRHIEMPMTPARIWHAIQAAKQNNHLNATVPRTRRRAC
jgi:carbon-monoxide dehydrogenase large subunit